MLTLSTVQHVITDSLLTQHSLDVMMNISDTAYRCIFIYINNKKDLQHEYIESGRL